MIYRTINLTDMLNEIGEDKTNEIFSDFSCPKDCDIEFFIKKKAIPFEKAGISKTYLIYALVDDQARWVGYYSLSRKPLFFKDGLSVKEKKLFYGTKFRVETGIASSPILNSGDKCIDSILLGQLSKNYHDGNDKYITGDVLINLAFERIAEWYQMCGGITMHLDCRNIPYIKKFYERHGFVCYNKRETSDGIYYVYIMPLKQLIKKLNEIHNECYEQKTVNILKKQ